MLLALLFLFAGVMVLPIEEMTKQIPLPGLFLRFIGVDEVPGAVGLILPSLLRIRPGLTPLAAVCLVVIMPALFPLLVGCVLVFVHRAAVDRFGTPWRVNCE